MTTRLNLWRPGGLGDAILLLPAIQKLNELEDKPYIAAFLHTTWGEMLRDKGLVDSVHRTSRAANPRMYEEIIESIGNMTSFLYTDGHKQAFQERLDKPDLLIAWSRDIMAARRGFEKMGTPRVVVEYWQSPPSTHNAEYMLNTLNNAGYPLSWRYTDSIKHLSFDYEIPRGILPSAFNKSRTVLIHPGAGGEEKRWPVERFQLLSFELDRAGWSTFIIEGPEERDLYKKLFPRSFIVRDMPLKPMATLLSMGMPYIGNDSGLSHLAAVCGGPITAIFTRTNPLQWIPLGHRVMSITRCEHATGNYYICSDPDCPAKITIDDVLQRFEDSLQT
jgi:heptosyltransferase-3